MSHGGGWDEGMKANRNFGGWGGEKEKMEAKVARAQLV